MRATAITVTAIFWAALTISTMGGCTQTPPPPPERMSETAQSQGSEPISQPEAKASREDEASPKAVTTPGRLPVRYQQPAYLLPQTEPGDKLIPADELQAGLTVGVDIASPSGPIPLRDILRRLTSLKRMNISWASDVNQQIPVDVDINADDDFFEAIDNILRQVDYYHEVKKSTVVVKYRETRTFQIAMPFMTSTYSSGVGGDVLGAGGLGGGNTLVGNIQLTSNNNVFDIWENIRTNLDQILNIWEETIQTGEGGEGEGGGTVTRRNVQGGKGYYSIDKPIGLITVTAPRPLVERIESYLNNLKKQMFRQISIEAKIIEVNLDDESRSGIDWRGVLSGKSINFEVFGPSSIVYPAGGRAISQVGFDTTNPFNILLDAIEEQGTANVLANPKISVMNGQPALISVGETFRYISEASTTVSEGVVSTSVSTDTVMSGLGLAVLPTISENDEIILSLTPVTSQVTSPMEERSFSGLTLQLPQINIREMKSMVKVRNGDTLLIGGLIDNSESVRTHKAPVLGDLPGVGKLFRHDLKSNQRKELVILLQPTIL